MPDKRPAGKIILLNGASSSGKTTLARALQHALPEPFWHFSIDHLRAAGVLPMERIKAGDFDWPAMRPAFFDGFHHSLPVLAEAGNNLIIEHIVESEEWMQLLLRLLHACDVFFVGVHCPLPELEHRERERGNRRIGEARDDFLHIHGYASYDLEIDSTHSVDGNVGKVIAAWEARQQPSAFDQMRATREKLALLG